MKRLLPALLASMALTLVSGVVCAQTIQKAGATSIGKCTVNGAVKPCVLMGATLVPLPVTAADLASLLGNFTGDTTCSPTGGAYACKVTGINGTPYPSSGMIKSVNGAPTAAVAGTDYLAPAGSGASLTGITPTQVGALPIGGGTLTGALQLTNGLFDANSLSRGIGFEPAATITVPNLMELDAFRISGTFVVGQSSGTGVGGQFAGLNFQETLASGSDHSANLYGVIGAVNNNGTGSVKAIYGRANCSNVQSDPTYATCIAGVFNVNTGANQNFAANIQMNAVTNASGKAVNNGIWLQSANPDGSAALYTYGFLIQNVSIQAGGAAFQANALGPGDFLTFNNAANNAHIFEVDAAGQVGAGMGAGGFGLSENLSVYKYAVLGTPGTGNVSGIIGDTGDGNFVIGSQGNYPLELRVNATLQAYLTASGFTVGGTPSSPNGITIGQSTIARNVSAGNLAINSGSSAVLSLVGGTSVQIGAPQVQFTQIPTSSTASTKGSACIDANNNIFVKTTTGPCF